MRGMPALITSKNWPSSFFNPCDHALDRLLQFGIRVLHHVGHDLRQLIEERLVDAHLVAVQHRAADQLADDVALLLVVRDRRFRGWRRCRPARGRRCGGGGGPCHRCRSGSYFTRQTSPAASTSGRRMSMWIVRLDALQHRGHPLEAHAGVDVLARQRAEVVGRVADAVELREDQVPDLDLRRRACGT